MSSFQNKKTGEIVKADKDVIFDSTTLSRQEGYWVYTKERTDFLAKIYFERQYLELTNQTKE